MTFLRLSLSLFGVMIVLCILALGRQLWTEHFRDMKRRRSLRGTIEGWFLLVSALAVAARYLSALVGAAAMPGIESGWLIGYGACCGIYLAVKAIRAFPIHD